MRKLLLGLSLVLALSACKPTVTVTNPETGEKSKITMDQGNGTNTITINSAEGKGTVSMSTSSDAPKDLPTYMPAYPGAKYEGSFATNVSKSEAGAAMKGGMVTFNTPDDADKVLAFYKDAFTRAGLKETGSGDMSGLKMIAFNKGDSDAEGAQVMASAAPAGGTQVQLIYSSAP